MEKIIDIEKCFLLPVSRKSIILTIVSVVDSGSSGTTLLAQLSSIKGI